MVISQAVDARLDQFLCHLGLCHLGPRCCPIAINEGDAVIVTPKGVGAGADIIRQDEIAVLSLSLAAGVAHEVLCLRRKAHHQIWAILMMPNGMQNVRIFNQGEGQAVFDPRIFSISRRLHWPHANHQPLHTAQQYSLAGWLGSRSLTLQHY